MAYHSNARQYKAQFTRQIHQRVTAASIYLTGQIKADISQPGTLRYNPVGKTGKRLKTSRTVYNFTHSRPGNPPFKQTGNLRMSIAYEVLQLVGRVGSSIKNPKYPYYLEMGTRRMAARPYLRRALIVHRVALKQILTRTIPPDGLAPVRSNQFRSGHFGRGARRRWAGTDMVEPTFEQTTAVAAIPANVVEALSRYLETDPLLSNEFAGGWSNGDADRDTPLPFGVLVKADTKRINTWKPGYTIDRVLIHLFCVAPSPAEAERMATLVKSRLIPSDTYTPPALVSADGVEPSGLSRLVSTDQGGERTGLDPQRGPLNADVWTAFLPVLITVARGG